MAGIPPLLSPQNTILMLPLGAKGNRSSTASATAAPLTATTHRHTPDGRKVFVSQCLCCCRPLVVVVPQEAAQQIKRLQGMHTDKPHTSQHARRQAP